MSAAPDRPNFTAGIAPVDVTAPDQEAEKEARRDAALQQALDKARDLTGQPDPEIDRIHCGDVFEVDGEHYVMAVVFLTDGDPGEEGER